MEQLDLFEETPDKEVWAYPVIPVIDRSVRGLCVKPYPLHPKGCPNFNKCDRCPPKARMYDEAYDMREQVWAVVNEFAFGAHVARMKAKHPRWSERQCKCVLYWQNGARAALKVKVQLAMHTLYTEAGKIYGAESCPEAMGVNVTQTLKEAGVELEWPPVNIARQVALLGIRRQA